MRDLTRYLQLMGNGGKHCLQLKTDKESLKNHSIEPDDKNHNGSRVAAENESTLT